MGHDDSAYWPDCGRGVRMGCVVMTRRVQMRQAVGVIKDSKKHRVRNW